MSGPEQQPAPDTVEFLLAEVDRKRARVAAVRALHFTAQCCDPPCCTPYCEKCDEDFPCAIVRVLDTL